MSHVLVEWIGGEIRQFSVIRREDIANGELRTKGDELKGQVISVIWKSRQHDAKVLEIGNEQELDVKADEFAEEAASKVTETETIGSNPKPRTKRDRRTKGAAKATAIQHVLDSVANPNDLAEDNVEEQPVKNYEDKYRKLKEKYKSLKKRYHELQRGVLGEAEIELYPDSGVFIKRSELDALKLLSSNPTTLARNLFRSIFSKEELKTHSLYGKLCNANKTEIGSRLPPLDAARRDAVIGYVLKDIGLDSNVGTREGIKMRKTQKRDITRYLSDFLRECRHSV